MCDQFRTIHLSKLLCLPRNFDRGIKYQHANDRTTTSTRTVGTKCKNTLQQRLHVARSSRICRSTTHNTGTRFQQECTHFTKIVKTPHKYSRQKGDKKQITYRGCTNIRCHFTKFSRLGDLDLCTSRLLVFTDTSSCQSRVKADRRTDEIRLHGIRLLRQCAHGNTLVPPASLLAPLS